MLVVSLCGWWVVGWWMKAQKSTNQPRLNRPTTNKLSYANKTTTIFGAKLKRYNFEILN